jgi:hypothetical protein
VTTVTTDVLKIFEGRFAENTWTRKRRRTLENKNEERRDVLQGEDIVRFIISLRLR